MQWSSGLTERPQDHHKPIPPETGWILAGSLVFAGFVFGIMGLVHHLGKQKPRALVEPIEDLVRDAQEWAAYPRPEDK